MSCILYSANIGVGVDLIPFGDIQDGSEISWPPHNDFVMNVAGFSEALESAILVQVDARPRDSGRFFARPHHSQVVRMG